MQDTSPACSGGSRGRAGGAPGQRNAAHSGLGRGEEEGEGEEGEVRMRGRRGGGKEGGRKEKEREGGDREVKYLFL